MLLSRLSVKSDLLRTYIINITYTGKDPALAVVIANAFAAEFLRSCKLQILSEQHSLAEAALSKQLAMFGDKHPRVTQAKMRLVATDNLLKEQLSEAPEALLQAAGENITKAIAASASPKPGFVISLLLLFGLVVGIAVALWLERSRWAEALSRFVRPSLEAV